MTQSATETITHIQPVALPIKEWGARYGLSYRETAKLVRNGLIPCLDLGYHTKRIPIAEGDAAMLKLAGGEA